MKLKKTERIAPNFFLNLNKSCIEITRKEFLAKDLNVLNLNKSCIEIGKTNQEINSNTILNLNKSCIEIDYTLRINDPKST